MRRTGGEPPEFAELTAPPMTARVSNRPGANVSRETFPARPGPRTRLVSAGGWLTQENPAETSEIVALDPDEREIS